MTAVHREPGPPRPRHPRTGLTLVELLVAVAIVATLTALLVPTIAKSMRAARNTAIKAEIDMLNAALLNYRSEYGEFPPCTDSSLPTSGRYLPAGQAARHIQRLFPRCGNAASQLNAAAETGNLPRIEPATALTAWLAGFTPDPRNPLTPPRERVKLFEFDKSRERDGTYAPVKTPSSPYIYIDSAHYQTVPYTDSNLSTPGAHFRNLRTVPNPPPVQPDQVSAWRFTDDGSGSGEFFNPDTFQIICAGLDEQFGTDDDLSNFWPGTRKEYLDSLRRSP